MSDHWKANSRLKQIKSNQHWSFVSPNKPFHKKHIFEAHIIYIKENEWKYNRQLLYQHIYIMNV